MATPLAWGSDAGGPIPRTIAREHFLTAIHELLPEAITDLVTADAIAMVEPGHTAPSTPLANHIAAWQEHYGLCERWLGEMAYLTLMAHATGLLDASSDLPWAYYPGGIAMAIEGDPGPIWTASEPITLPAMEWEWSAKLETRAMAKGRILAEVEALIDAQLEEAQGGSFPSVPVKDVKHFRWLAMYQCKGMSRNQIAAAVACDRTQVGRAIGEAAALVNITLRKALPGRPKGSKTVRLQNDQNAHFPR